MFRIRKTWRAVRAVWSSQPRADHVGLARAAHAGQKHASVVVLGDSLAERAPWSALLGAPVVNAGYGGMLTREVTEWAPEVLHSGVETVVLWVGTNDALEGSPRSHVEAHFLRLFDVVRGASPAAQIVALTLPPLSAHAQQVDDHAAVLRDLDAHKGVTVVHVTDALRAPGTLIGDGVHISGRGYEVIGQAVRDALSRAVK